MDIDEVHPFTSHFHPSPSNVPPLLYILPTPSQQSIKTTLPIHVSHIEGTSNIVAHPTPLQDRPFHLVGCRMTYFDSEMTLAQHIAKWSPTIFSWVPSGSVPPSACATLHPPCLDHFLILF